MNPWVEPTTYASQVDIVFYQNAIDLGEETNEYITGNDTSVM